MVTRVRSILAAATALACLGLAMSPAAQAVDGSAATSAKQSAAKPHKWQPRPGGTFNVPRGSLENELRIEHQVTSAINHAPKGSRIRIALFSFDRKPVASALIRAHKRGVQVQILLNNHQVTPAQKMLHAALGKNRHRKNFSYECSNGCRSKGENQHIKFYLFSKTGGAEDVVMTGSANMTMNGAANQYNDLYTHNNGPDLYKAFNDLFDSMRKDKIAHPSYWVRDIGDSFELQATPYHYPGPKHDPIITILNRVHCKGAGKGSGNTNHRTIVRVSMHTWNEDRGKYLADKYRQLYAAGCDVRLMYGMAGEKVRNAFDTRTPRGYVPVHTDGADTNEDGELDLYSHQKILLVSGNYGKDRSTHLIVTGSSNYNDDGLTGDEEIFLIKNAVGAYKNYITNFQWIWSSRSHLVEYIPYGSRQVARDRDITDGTGGGRLRSVPGTASGSGWDFDPRLGTAGPEWEDD